MSRTAVTNVRVFDGSGLTEPRTVVIDGATIGDDPAGAREIDGGGGVLLPGLIDAHIHLHGRDSLEQLARHGVTTGLDMATFSADLLASLRNQPGLTDIRSAGVPAIGPGGMHARIPGMPAEAVVTDPGQAKDFVAARVAAGSDYLKIVLEVPGGGGPELPAARALTEAAHEAGLLVVAHATSAGAYTMALDAGVDVLTHAPLGAPITADDVARAGIVAPTLIMMKGVSATAGRPQLYEGAKASVTALYRAGVPVLAGTDANNEPGVPAKVAHGASLHDELELLVDAGLSTVDALRAATVLPAKHFGLGDRGAIQPGLRADLVLVDGDPLADIRATRAITRVWCAGTEVKDPAGR
ncbi:amidohydrolase family protein [Amycolatopsis sp., V23-08]|uniref:Amidohydrolase family protein n=1 Tax=Amycolatopsis heterodermiae TaxID=3110235 RepID=A0ABU5RLA4_9PSEU|nr:amidohydrolase family protein [Amycolatopsis sp., V23-08]MEA5367057.1 amidohydrolase family protein [Amycolatopsis sp., V23-08]